MLLFIFWQRRGSRGDEELRLPKISRLAVPSRAHVPDLVRGTPRTTNTSEATDDLQPQCCCVPVRSTLELHDALARECRSNSAARRQHPLRHDRGGPDTDCSIARTELRDCR